MGVKVATSCLHWSQPVVPHSPPCSQTLTSAISSPSMKRIRCEKALVCRCVHRLHESNLFGKPSSQLYRSRSCDHPKRRVQTVKRACSASLDSFSDEEFAKKIQELALRFQLSDEDDENSSTSTDAESESIPDSRDEQNETRGYSCNIFSEESSKIDGNSSSVQNQGSFWSSSIDPVEPSWLEGCQVPSDWQERDENIMANIERKANSVDLPFSLRIIKRKKQWQDGFREAGESACCSVKKAFSSMVFIIRELHSYTLQMREILFYEDMQGILARVQKEMHASFVWLFQQVFSHTPTLMVYVMILLANFTVHSMSANAAIAAAPPPQTYAAATETVSLLELRDQRPHKFDSSTIKTFSASSSGGKTTSIGGNNGGGGKVRPVASGTEGDGRSERSSQHGTIIPDGASQVASLRGTGESVSGKLSMEEEEVSLWNSMVDEALTMQNTLRDGVLNHETMQWFVSPVTAKIEPDDYLDYFRTELLYQMGLAQDPNNPLLLTNFAQFLYLVAHDYDRAEECFKKAIGVEPPNAEAYSKYATFLWKVRKDLWAAEETYLEAISADPANAYHAGNYAHFLWNTGGEDTCFPLDTPNTNTNIS